MYSVSAEMLEKPWRFNRPEVGLAAHWESAKEAMEGLAYTVKEEPSFRDLLLVVVAATGLGLYRGLSASQWRHLATAAVVMIIAELSNTSIEMVADLIAPEPHPSIRITKHVAGAMQLVASVAGGLGWLHCMLKPGGKRHN